MSTALATSSIDSRLFSIRFSNFPIVIIIVSEPSSITCIEIKRFFKNLPALSINSDWVLPYFEIRLRFVNTSSEYTPILSLIFSRMVTCSKFVTVFSLFIPIYDIEKNRNVKQKINIFEEKQ